VRKGRYGWDYAASPQRLTVPLIRREESYPKGALSADVRGDMDKGGEANDHGMTNDGNPKGKRKGGKRGRKPGGLVDYAEVLPHFREATWEEALDLVARRLSQIYAERGPSAIAGFGSAKCSNEEAYLFQKLIRTGFHTNNIDHCTRLCHASSVSALFEGIGSGAVSTTFGDVINAEVAIVAGSNAPANHPVASSFFKQARRNGTTIIYIDPRADKMADHSDIFCQLKPGTDVAFYNGVMHEVIRLGLTDDAFIADRTSNYEALRTTVADYPPERAEQITGVPADVIRRVARVWGEARSGVIYWGMGISQHTYRHRQRPLPDRDVRDHRQRRQAGCGLHPLRGQNNVQGASDMGLIPMFYPDYAKADDPAVKARFEQAWGTADLDPAKGLTVTEIIGSRLAGRGARHVHAGREPVPVRPEHQQGPQGTGQARVPRRAGHLPHRDGRVRRRHPARVLLPGKGRHLHQHRPPGAARAARCSTPRPGAGRLGGRAGHREQDRAQLGLPHAPGHLRGDGLGHPQL
jgi:formate dehydrogenase major subunit